MPCHPGVQITAIKAQPIEAKELTMENQTETQAQETAPQIDMEALDAIAQRLGQLEAKARHLGAAACVVEGAARKAVIECLRADNGEAKALSAARGHTANLNLDALIALLFAHLAEVADEAGSRP